MSDNKKQEKDYTSEVDTLLPEAEASVKVCIFPHNQVILVHLPKSLVGQTPRRP